MAPKISVLLPAYNVERYVETALESLRRQTFNDYEVIAVDDDSTDQTAAILSASQSASLRVAKNPSNLGMTANWNRCLSLATGDLVLKLDADDALHPQALERLAQPFSDPDLIAAGIRSLQCDEELQPFDGIDGDDAMARGGVNPYRDHILAGRRWLAIAARGHQLWSSSAFMVRRADLERLGGWDERFGCASDSELILRVLEQNRPVAHVGSVGAFYRVRKGSISDEYRSRGWLTWEGVAAYLLSMSRRRRREGLSRSLRMHYVRLWWRWKGAAHQLPEAIDTKLRDVMREVPPPPVADRLMTRLRDSVAGR